MNKTKTLACSTNRCCRQFIASSLIAILLISLKASMGYAASSDAAQQALAQLRLLQQRMSQADANNPQANTAIPGQVPSGLSSTLPTQPGAGPAAVPGVPAGAAVNKSLIPGAAQPVASALTSLPTPPLPPTQINNPNFAPNDKSGVEEQVMQVSDKTLIESKAFDNVTRQMFPLTPEQILSLKQTYHTNQYAETSPVGTPPKPTATSQFVNLSPGSTPPVIRLSQGFVSSLVFLDSTGAPWPIHAYDLGDSTAFNIQWDKTSNTLMIQALKLYNYGNLAVRLRGLNTPVMLTLIPGQKAVDYRVDLRVQGYGPNAKSMPMEAGLPPSANDILLHVLDGVPPQGSRRLTVSGGDARAWVVNEKMYVRTDLTILSPGWIGSMTSADGMHAYEMQKSPVLLVSWHGKVMQLKVEGL